MMCLGVGPLCVHLVWDSVLPGLVCLFPSLGKVREVLSFFFQIGFQFLAVSFQQPHDVNVGLLEVVPEAASTILIFLDYFFFSLF